MQSLCHGGAGGGGQGGGGGHDDVLREVMATCCCPAAFLPALTPPPVNATNHRPPPTPLPLRSFHSLPHPKTPETPAVDIHVAVAAYITFFIQMDWTNRPPSPDQASEHHTQQLYIYTMHSRFCQDDGLEGQEPSVRRAAGHKDKPRPKLPPMCLPNCTPDPS
jgi:hypothetical protein